MERLLKELREDVDKVYDDFEEELILDMELLKQELHKNVRNIK